MRSRQMLLDQGLERAIAVPQRLGHIRVDLAGTVAGVERDDALEEFRDTRNRRLKHVALVYRPFRSVRPNRVERSNAQLSSAWAALAQAFWCVTPAASSGVSGCITPTIPCFRCNRCSNEQSHDGGEYDDAKQLSTSRPRRQ